MNRLFVIALIVVFGAAMMHPAAAAQSQPYGIDHRILWTHSHVIGSPDAPLPYTVVNAFPKLKIFQPIYLIEEPGTDDFLVIQHLGNRMGPGNVLRFRNDPNVDHAEELLSL